MTRFLTQRKIDKRTSTSHEATQNKPLDDSERAIPVAADRLLCCREVVILSGLSRTTIFRKELEGTFPMRLKISARRVGWKLTEVDEWIQQRKPALIKV